jgi:hypothetical protein
MPTCIFWDLEHHRYPWLEPAEPSGHFGTTFAINWLSGCCRMSQRSLLYALTDIGMSTKAADDTSVSTGRGSKRERYFMIDS